MATLIRHIAVALPLFVAPLGLLAQTAGGFATATLSEVYPVCKDCKSGRVVADTNGFLHITQEPEKKLYLTKVGTDLKVARSSELDIKEEYDKMDEGDVKILKAGNRSYLFYNLYSKKEKTDIIYCREFSIAKGGFTPGRKLAMRSEKARLRTLGGFAFGSNTPTWNVAASPDGSKIVVDIDEWDKKVDPRGPAYNNVRVFDADMKPLWARRVSLDNGLEVKFFIRSNEVVNSRQSHIWDNFAVSNEGAVYAVGKFIDEEVESSKLPAYGFRFSKWTKEAKEPIQLSFRLGDKFSDDYKLVIDKNANLTFVGFYHSTKKAFSGAAGGIAAVQVHEEGGAFKTRYTALLPFSTSVIASYEKERIQRKVEGAENRGKEVELTNLDFKDVVVHADGTLDVCMEQYEVQTRTTMTGNNTTYTTTSYLYNDGYLMRINPEGVMGWMVKIPKRNGAINQTLKENTFGTVGYRAVPWGKNMYLFYMDNYDNKDLSTEQTPHRFDEGDKGNLVALKVTPDGKVYKQLLLDVGKDLDLSVHNSFLMAPNKLAVRGKIDKKTEQICLIEFN